MRNLLLLIALASLGFCSLAHAQCNTDPNEIGIFWTQDCTQCVNCLDYFGGPATAYVVLINPTQAAGVSGYEFCLTNADGSYFLPPPAVFLTGYVYPPGAYNVNIEPCFSVGLASPMPWSPCITLLSINLLVFDFAPWCFGVKPYVPSAIPGHMLYCDGANPALMLPMYPNNGPNAPDYAMACLNSPLCPPYPVAVEERSWGTLKSLYR
jgi:hypothetical protein